MLLKTQDIKIFLMFYLIKDDETKNEKDSM